MSENNCPCHDGMPCPVHGPLAEQTPAGQAEYLKRLRELEEEKLRIGGHEMKLTCGTCGELIAHLSGYRDAGFYAVARCPKCDAWFKLNLTRGAIADG